MKKALYFLWSIPFFLLAVFCLIMMIDSIVSGSKDNYDHLDPDHEWKTYVRYEGRIDSIRYNRASFTLRPSAARREEERLHTKHKYFISYNNRDGESIPDSVTLWYNESKTQDDYAVGGSIIVYVNSNRTSPTIEEEQYNSLKPSQSKNTLVIVICLIVGLGSAGIGYFLIKTGRS